MFWADEIVEDILKKLPKESYLVTDWTTPSGSAHIGSLRGMIVHDLVRLGLNEKNRNTNFKFGFDDFDPMDGLPSYIDQSFSQHMGKPLCDVPAPDGKHQSFADQFSDELKKVILALGSRVEFINISEAYKTGKYNEMIRTILDHAVEIRTIYQEISGSKKPENWYPFQVVCPKCGKIGTTIVTAWDGKEVEFECQENLVEWAKGCSYQGKISPFDGNGKMPWKVDWACRWQVFGTDIEGAGKDHSAAGGSRDIADHICHEIFKKQPPYDVPYEFVLIGGVKMSSSKGLGVTAKTMSDFLPSNILRFLFTRTKAKRTIEFNPEGDSIPLLYDEYDRCATAFIKDQKSDLGRAYYYTEINPAGQSPLGGATYPLRFSKIAYMLQMPRVDILEYAEKEKEEELSETEKLEIENRIAVAKKWLEKYAPESFKFSIATALPDAAKNLSKQQKEFLAKVLESIKQKEWQGEDLHKKIHEIKTEMNLPARDAFSAIYLTFIGKDSGPQAGWLLASLDKEFVIKRLGEVS